MKKPITTVMVGAGGYASGFVKQLLHDDPEKNFQLVGVVDPYAKSAPLYEEFKALVPVYDHLEEFYAAHTAELAVISTPIHLHFDQCRIALENGSYTLCEKPLVPSLAQLNQLDALVEKSGKALAVGFQWCFSPVMLAIKKRILAGEFGKPKLFKCLVSWPRDWAYYARTSGWAGKIKTADGALVNDSVVSNATAHYLQNSLFLLGETMEDAAMLTNTRVECYRANDIETFDTIALSGEAGGAKVYYSASHAVNFLIEPLMCYEFENAQIHINLFNQNSVCTIHHADGRVENLGHGLSTGNRDKMIHMAESIRGERPWTCTIRTVCAHTTFIDLVAQKVPVQAFTDNLVVRDETRRCTYVKNLHMDLWKCYQHAMLPAEMNMTWAVEGTVI